ncbi:MAG: LacI family DNA-binding transcriptional regulator [Ruthenibacterium sp.]
MTIKDIARESGYAVSTVSRALNDHPDVSNEAKHKIKEIIARVGFVPNNNARQLKVQQSSNILILVKGAFNLFFAGVLERIQTAIASAGYSAEVHYLDEDADEVLAGEQLQRERKPLGLLFLGGNVEVFRRRFAAITVPSVLATTVSQDLDFQNLSCVGVDDAAAGGEACEYLLQKGHRSIAVMGGKREMSYVSALRYAGFCRAYTANRGAQHPEALYRNCSFSMDSGYRAMNRLLQGSADGGADGSADKLQITAVFCMSDLIAIGAMRAIHEAGLRVPEDISVLGFDGIELARFCIPQLATIRQPQQDIAQSSVQQLLAAIEHAAPRETVILPTTLVVGESVRAL